MIYILVALKAEAQAFVDKFKLKNYKNENISVMVSGIGRENMKRATMEVLNNFKDNDIIANVGICGANLDYDIGQLIQIDAINYKNQTYTIKKDAFVTIECMDEEVNNSRYEIVDMESYGFYDAIIHSSTIKNILIFKVVSDHFEPRKVTKDGTKSLIFNAIDKLFALNLR